MTHFISGAFGFIAVFIIIKGFMDINRKMKKIHFFDKIYQAENDTLRIVNKHGVFILFPGGKLKCNTHEDKWYLTDGSVLWYDTKDSVKVRMPGGTVNIFQAQGYVLSSRFPEIFIKSGRVQLSNVSIQGHNLFYDDYKKQTDTLKDLNMDFPFYIRSVTENDSIKTYNLFYLNETQTYSIRKK